VKRLTQRRLRKVWRIFCVFDVACCRSACSATFPKSAATQREKTRLTKEHGDRIDTGGKIGGAFSLASNPTWISTRTAVYDEIMAAQKARLQAKKHVPIKITLPDGGVKEGVSWQTTPLNIAEGISKGLAASVVVAQVQYSSRIDPDEADLGVVNTGPEEEEAGAARIELWDLNRPLEGDCQLWLKKFDDKEGKMVCSLIYFMLRVVGIVGNVNIHMYTSYSFAGVLALVCSHFGRVSGMQLRR
jgi:hypothetical protein